MYHYAVNNMLKYSKDINKIYDDCLTHFSKLAILKKVIKKDEDFVCIIKLKNDNVFGEEILGCPRKDIGESLIL